MHRGSAFPAPLVLQIRELARETNGAFALDAVITVVDCENFKGFEDTSPTAKMQAQFSDVILLVCTSLSTPARVDMSSTEQMGECWRAPLIALE